MTTSDVWRPPKAVSGPFPIRLTDIDAVNRVFADAFTERYRRDGMVGVRVPQLNPAIWRYAIEDSRDGAMLWRDEHNDAIAFNVAHHSGVEGWMGPLAVRPEWQGTGLGKSIVTEGIAWLKANGARVIGLETMPRTMDNIGFYSALGFLPGRLTITLTLEAASSDGAAPLLGMLPARARSEAIAECRALSESLLPGYDFTREIELTMELGLGDVALLHVDGSLAGFALFPATPLVEGRSREEMRVLKLALRDVALASRLAAVLKGASHKMGTRRVAVRVQSEYRTLYSQLIASGGRVRWTDLRMTLTGYEERRAEQGVVLSNWEI